MAKHFLSLIIPETYNTEILTVIDETIYAPEVQITCATLEVFPPGFNTCNPISVLQGFNIKFSTCLLGMQTDCTQSLGNLPDGIYVIRYSVSPNDKVFVEYNYLRVTGILNVYYHVLSQVELQPCNPPAEIEAKLKELNTIKSYIDAAKVKVEVQHNPEDGLALLRYAKHRLDRMFLHTRCAIENRCLR